MKLILVTIFLSFVIICSAQRDYTIDIEHTRSYEFQQIRIFPLQDNGEYITLSQSKESASSRPFNRLELMKYDSCGLADFHQYIMENLFGITSFQIYGIRNDSLIFFGRSQTVNDHPYSDGFIARINLNDYGMDYTLYRLEQGVYIRDIDYAEDGSAAILFTHNQADKPLRYHMAILKNYEIHKMVDMNYGEFTLTGSVVSLPDGGFITHSERHIWRVDQNLNFIWFKAFEPRVNIAMQGSLDGNIVALVRNFRRPYYAQIVKLNLNGEILDYSRNIVDNIDVSYISHFRPNRDGRFLNANMNWSRDTIQSQMIFSLLDSDVRLQTQVSWNIDPFRNNTLLNDIRMQDDRIFWCASKRNAFGFHTGTLTLNSTTCAPREIIASQDIDPLFTLIDDNFPRTNDTIIEVIHRTYTPVATNIATDFICVDPFEFIELLPTDTSFCSERPWTIDLNIIPYDQVRWTDGFPDRLRPINESGTYGYEIMVCDSIFTESVTVSVADCACTPFLANAFTPNSDGRNDVWELYGNCPLIESFSIKIYNRWGSLLYHSTDPDFKWNGEWNNTPVSEGVYAYILEYSDLAFGLPEKRTFSGDLTLIR